MNNLVTNAALSNLIYIPQTADARLTQLSEGHLLRATVQRVNGDTALLNVGGVAVQVRSEIPLEPQQRVILQVTQAGADQVTLQVVSQTGPAGATNQAGAATLPNNLELLLTSWNLEADATNQTIAKALFHFSQSLDPETMQAVRQLWQQLPAFASLPDGPGAKIGALETLVYLHTNQLPVNQESLSLAHHLLNNPLDIAQRLTDLQQALRTAQNQIQTLLSQTQGSTGQQSLAQTLLQPGAGQPQTAQLTQMLATINSTLSQIGNWTISADTPTAEMAARLANIIINLGTPPETGLAKHVPTAASPNFVNGEGLKSASPGQAPHQNNLDAASQNGRLSTQTSAAGAGAAPLPDEISPQPAQHTSQLPHFKALGQNLIRSEAANPLQQLAATISEALSNPDLDDAAAHALRTLSNQIETLSKDLGAIQFSNLTHAPEPATEPYYLFPIPLTTSDGPQTAHLKVYRRHHKGGQLDPDNLRLALLLDLPEIGEIAVNLTVFKRHLNGQILSRRPSTHQLVETELGDLELNLSKLGYRIDALTCSLLSPNEPLTLNAPDTLDDIEVPMPQINITA